ncbi:DUF721 domain-containing protein [Candidatus Lariskella endosymbiont of Hedychridium roseum]|uniref:DUF721 domain-containing protein n=1 Tax=Candidatus Lariskella endosymbiont of Hedychridium roseum TaxID=3077949 RepID=UPI0030D0883D
MLRNSRLKAGFKSLNIVTNTVLGNILSSCDAVAQKIGANWIDIVGRGLANISYPSDIAFNGESRARGTLTIEISNPGFALEMQSCQQTIISRVNSYFGYEAVAQVKIKVRKSQVFAKKSD